jgi:hypothetical protein
MVPQRSLRTNSGNKIDKLIDTCPIGQRYQMMMAAMMMTTAIIRIDVRHPLPMDVFPRLPLPLPFGLDFTLRVDDDAACFGECAFSLRAFPCALDFSLFPAMVPPDRKSSNYV